MLKNSCQCILILSLIPILLLTSCNSDLSPKALASEATNIVGNVKSDSVSVFDEIQRNIDLVTQLKAHVQEAQLNNEPMSLEEAIKDVETVTTSYEALTSRRDDIRKELLLKITKIENMRNIVDSEVESLRKKKSDYQQQLRTVFDPNPEIVRTRSKALTKAIEYVDDQIGLWQEFNRIMRDITLEMSDIQERIDRFLSMIESTAILFREGLNLLNLQKDINEALSLFTSDLPRMEELTQDMEASWDNLDYLLNSLTGVVNLSVTQ